MSELSKTEENVVVAVMAFEIRNICMMSRKSWQLNNGFTEECYGSVGARGGPTRAFFRKWARHQDFSPRSLRTNWPILGTCALKVAANSPKQQY